MYRESNLLMDFATEEDLARVVYINCVLRSVSGTKSFESTRKEKKLFISSILSYMQYTVVCSVYHVAGTFGITFPYHMTYNRVDL